MENSAIKVRLDKWLWAARFFKTRSLAKEAIEGGKVHYNKQRCKPGKTVDVGALLTIRIGWMEKEILIKDLSEKRLGAPLAQKLYEETAESVAKREKTAWERKHFAAAQLPPARRPSKRDRRLIHRFKEQQDS